MFCIRGFRSIVYYSFYSFNWLGENPPSNSTKLMNSSDPHFEEFEQRCIEVADRFMEQRSALSQIAAYQQLMILKKSNTESFDKVLQRNPDIEAIIDLTRTALEAEGSDVEALEDWLALRNNPQKKPDKSDEE